LERTELLATSLLVLIQTPLDVVEAYLNFEDLLIRHHRRKLLDRLLPPVVDHFT